LTRTDGRQKPEFDLKRRRVLGPVTCLSLGMLRSARSPRRRGRSFYGGPVPTSLVFAASVEWRQHAVPPADGGGPARQAEPSLMLRGMAGRDGQGLSARADPGFREAER
jgi:hypothetical protein